MKRKLPPREYDQCQCATTKPGPAGCLSSLLKSQGVLISGHVDISHCKALTTLPQGLKVSGDLVLMNCQALTTLPPGLQVSGDLLLTSCDSLITLPENVQVGGDLSLAFCSNLSSLPANLLVSGGLDLCGCRALTQLPEELNVNGDLNLSFCSQLQSLPRGLRVAGNLTLQQCTLLAALPNDLQIGGDIDLGYCRSLSSLPHGLTVAGHLSLIWTSITTLPNKLNVSGSLLLFSCNKLISLAAEIIVGLHLDLSNCSELTSLPDDLKVGGTLTLRGCSSLVNFPPGIYSTGHLDLFRCMHLKSLPPSLTVAGDLNLDGCVRLERLPHGLRVAGKLSLIGTALNTLPDDLVVEGSLRIARPGRLTTLPDKLRVSGDFVLTNCISLVCLPSGLSVGGDLRLRDCRSLTSLPTGLSVGGDLDLRDCICLTSLPPDIVSWGQTSAGRDRIIDLTNTAISATVRSRLQAHVPTGMSFIFGGTEKCEQSHTFSDLAAALTEWLHVKEDGRTIAGRFDTEKQEHIRQFLLRLHDTAEYRNPYTRTALIKRVDFLMQNMQRSESLTEACIERMIHALQSCSDRVIQLMNQLEVAVRVHVAQQGRTSKADLRALGIGLLKLEIVHQHALATCNRLTFADEVEVFLKYETRLREALQLPVSTSEMLYGADVSEAELKAALDAASEAATDCQKQVAFFAAWEPWIKYERTEAACGYSYEALPCRKLHLTGIREPVCPITQDALSDLHQPVAIGDADNPRVYESAAIIDWWQEHGREPAPAPQRAISLLEFWRPQSCKAQSIHSPLAAFGSSRTDRRQQVSDSKDSTSGTPCSLDALVDGKAPWSYDDTADCTVLLSSQTDQCAKARTPQNLLASSSSRRKRTTVDGQAYPPLCFAHHGFRRVKPSSSNTQGHRSHKRHKDKHDPRP